jgi:hybrid cluster-associated redox disulfide protein
MAKGITNIAASVHQRLLVKRHLKKGKHLSIWKPLYSTLHSAWIMTMRINLSDTTTIKDLLDQHPYLLHAFIEMGLMCVGCAADAFHTLADVAEEYGLNQDQFVARLQAEIDKFMATEETRG